MHTTTFYIDFEYEDLFDYAQQLAQKLGVNFSNNEIIYPSHIAKGSSRFFKINEFMSYQVAHYTARQRMIFKRSATAQNHITISFQDFTFAKCAEHDYDCNEIILNNKSLGSIQCKSTRMQEHVVIEAGMEVKVILVLMKEHWVDHVLHDSVSKERFIRYLVNQNANLRKEFLSPVQNKLYNEIFTGDTFTLLQNLYYDGRIMSLLESFLKEILTKEDEEMGTPFMGASYEDIQMLQVAERYLNDNLQHPFPGVEFLSRTCCMSRTKFINLFQKVYGLSSFEYSQKRRLLIAYDLMRSGNSVSETAKVIGYTGVNNFATAFKKEFGLLPSELIGQLREN